MNAKSTLIVFTILSIFLIHSCNTPKNLLKLQPETKNNSKWLYGKEFITDSINGIIFEAGFERCQNEQYCFNIKVINKSNLPVLIDPSDISLLALNAYHDSITKIAAINPENEILKLEKSLAKTEIREENHVGLSLLAAGIDIATGVATATDDNPDNDFLGTNLFETIQVNREINAFYAQDLKIQKDSWENLTLRKTTLDPNYNMEGKVFFPANRDAIYFKLLLPVDFEYIELNFEQLQIPVY